MNIQHLSYFIQKKCILDDISFSIKKGSKTILLGPNGAGKTTLLHQLATGYLATPLSKIGYAPEKPPLYKELTLLEYMRFIAHIRHLDLPYSKIAKLLLLDAHLHSPLNSLSKGYQQLVNILQSICHDPEILLWDEPFTHLDPHHVACVHRLLNDLSSTVLVSTHHLLETSVATWDAVMILNKGRLAYHEPYEASQSLDDLYHKVVR